MTDRNGIIREIEEMLGSEGTPALAHAMLEKLEQCGIIRFRVGRGYAAYVWDQEYHAAQAAFNACLAELVEASC